MILKKISPILTAAPEGVPTKTQSNTLCTASSRIPPACLAGAGRISCQTFILTSFFEVGQRRWREVSVGCRKTQGEWEQRGDQSEVRSFTKIALDIGGEM